MVSAAVQAMDAGLLGLGWVIAGFLAWRYEREKERRYTDRVEFAEKMHNVMMDSAERDRDLAKSLDGLSKLVEVRMGRSASDRRG